MDTISSNKKHLFIENSIRYGYIVLSLLFTFWLISLFEIYSKTSSGIQIDNTIVTLCFKIVNDSWTALIIGLLFFPLFALLSFLNKKVAIIILKIIFCLIVVGQYALVKYNLTTLVYLGADIMGYSFDDMYITVTASESFSFLYFLSFIIFPIALLVIDKLLEKYLSRKVFYIAAATISIVVVCLKLFVPSLSESNYQNKLDYFSRDLIRYQNEKQTTDVSALFYKKEYPLLQPSDETKDVLGPFFTINEEKPNVVILIIEGMGAEFIGKNSYHGFTPFLDSMIPKSLYWENFVSNTGRTFGVLPSLLGSLPYGEKGFLELKPLPSHVSLISVLKANQYTTSFYSGDESSFDRKINFLEYNGIENVIDINKFGSGYVKTKANSGGFSWGYPDAEIFKKTLSTLDGKKQPRLDIIMTLTTHEPFDFPSKNEYLKKVDSISQSNTNLELSKKQISTYKDIFACLLYTDTAIKNFMQAYAKRPEYKNTIFIITGDHRLIPVAQKDKLCRFHVPLLIYSPLLKKTASFKSVSSHWDVTPSLLSFLTTNYKLNKIAKTTWMSQGLDTVRQFRNIHKIPLMRSKGSINDYIYKDYLYSEGSLYKIKANFEIEKVNDKKLLATINDSLLEAKKLNAYLTKKNKIIPNSLNIYTQPAFQFTKSEMQTINKLVKGLNYDQIFFVARDLAFNKEREKARLLCNYILNEIPNYGDVRTLKARTLAWDGDYKKAETELLNVIKRTPFYEDAYLALMDVYWWSDQNAKAIATAKLALKNEVKTPQLSIKLAQAYKRNNEIASAEKIMDSIIKKNPKNTEYPQIKKSLRE
jgi:phosphoglycerol transferase MdoB-like AlkP superfamily enzyme